MNLGFLSRLSGGVSSDWLNLPAFPFALLSRLSGGVDLIYRLNP